MFAEIFSQISQYYIFGIVDIKNYLFNPSNKGSQEVTLSINTSILTSCP